ncbi:MAG: hypothetical protein KGM42_07100 [Hyphomicrobiales bacterium]|nr:hypothetical protein [Hyphomicrobiales bacterium]
MRLVSCVLVGLGLCAAVPVHAAAIVRGGAPAFLRPPAGVLHVGPQTRFVRPGFRHGHYHYATGFYGPYLAYPGYENAGALGGGGAVQIVAPRTNVWAGPMPVGQGDIGYVTQPAVYDVARELARRGSYARGPGK